MAGYLDMVRKWEQSRQGPHGGDGGDSQDCLVNESQRQGAAPNGSQAGFEQSSDCGKSGKSEIRVGDGQAPPLDRPPQTEQELRRLIDHLEDPEAFACWLEWAMNRFDPAEG